MGDFFIDLIAKIIGAIIGICLGGLVFWGIGSLMIFAFHINYSWTFLHGVICEIIFLLLKDIFRFEKGN